MSDAREQDPARAGDTTPAEPRTPKGLRLWLSLLAISCFLAGVVGGRLWGLRDRREPTLTGPFHDYAALLADRYELSDARKHYLRVILDHYDLDLRRLEERYLREFRSAIEPELRALGAEYDAYIRDHVVPPRMRDEYDRVAMRLPHPEPKDD